MLENLSALAYGIVAFAITVVVFTVMLSRVGEGVSGCPTTYSTYNLSSGLCTNTTGSTISPQPGATSAFYTTGQLSNTSGGLLSYLPAIVALGIGVLFLAWFGFKNKY